MFKLKKPEMEKILKKSQRKMSYQEKNEARTTADFLS